MKLLRAFSARLIFILLYILILSPGNASVKYENRSILSKEISQSVAVFICNSATAYAYHSYESCRGLNRCTHEIVRVSEERAQELGRRPCQVCWR